MTQHDQGRDASAGEVNALTSEVRALGGVVSDLNDLILGSLEKSEQAREAAARAQATADTAVPREEVDERAEELRAERRRGLITLALAFLLFVPVATYVAVWAHELYRDACVVNRVQPVQDPPGWCVNVFPFDERVGVDHSR